MLYTVRSLREGQAALSCARRPCAISPVAQKKTDTSDHATATRTTHNIVSQESAPHAVHSRFGLSRQPPPPRPPPWGHLRT